MRKPRNPYRARRTTMNVIKNARTTVPAGILSMVALIGLALLVGLSWWDLR